MDSVNFHQAVPSLSWRKLKRFADQHPAANGLTASQTLYVAEILFIAGRCATKLSACLLLRRLGREKPYLRLCQETFTLISVWGVASILAIALKCDLSRPWDVSSKCKNVVRVVSSFKFITDETRTPDGKSLPPSTSPPRYFSKP